MSSPDLTTGSDRTPSASMLRTSILIWPDQTPSLSMLRTSPPLTGPDRTVVHSHWACSESPLTWPAWTPSLSMLRTIQEQCLIVGPAQVTEHLPDIDLNFKFKLPCCLMQVECRLPEQFSWFLLSDIQESGRWGQKRQITPITTNENFDASPKGGHRFF